MSTFSGSIIKDKFEKANSTSSGIKWKVEFLIKKSELPESEWPREWPRKLHGELINFLVYLIKKTVS